MTRQATRTAERKSYHRSVRGDHVRRRRRRRERFHERLRDLRRGQEHHGPGGGELLPQRVAHPPRGRPEEARHAVPGGGGGRGRAGRRGGRRERGPRPRGVAEGARQDPGVAEPRERPRAEEAVRAAAAAARELLLLALGRGAARRGAEAAVHGWLAADPEGGGGGELEFSAGLGKQEGGFGFYDMR